jgi:hypothetical protein
VTKAIDSNEPGVGWESTGQVKDAVIIGKVQIPAGSEVVVGLVSGGLSNDDSPNWRLALLSITVNGESMPVNSSIAIPGKGSPMFNATSTLQRLAAQRRSKEDLKNGKEGDRLDADVDRHRLSTAPRIYLPPGEELQFIVTSKQLKVEAK